MENPLKTQQLSQKEPGEPTISLLEGLREQVLGTLVRRSVRRIANLKDIRLLLSNYTEHNLAVITRDIGIYSKHLLKEISPTDRPVEYWSADYLKSDPVDKVSTQRLYWLAMSDAQALSLAAKTIADHNFTIITLHVAPACGPYRLNETSWSYHLWWYWSFIKSIFSKQGLVVQIGAPFPENITITDNLRTLERAIKRSFQQSAILTHGPFFLTRSRQLNAILNSTYFQSGVQQIAESTKQSQASLRKAATKEFKQMAAAPRRWILAAGSFVTERVLNRLYPRRTIIGIESLRTALKGGAVVLVPTHRSHLDYVIISKILYDQGLNPPLVAAGVNLRFWPFGGFIRGVGAFFIKRDATNDRIHSLVLKTYVRFLTRRGHLQEFFIEGGRSRSGHLLGPKLGLLGTYVNLVAEGIKKDILFVPVGIAYERLVEEKGFGQENTGATKTKETFFSLLKARSFLRQSYGEVAVDFGEPLSLREYISNNSTKSEKDITRGFAKQLMYGISDHCPVTLSALASTVLFECPNYGATEALFQKRFTNAIAFLELMREHSFPIGRETTTLQEALHKLEESAQLPNRPHISQNKELVTLGTLNKAIQHTELPGGIALHIPGSLRYSVAFYRNSLANALAVPAIFSLCEDYYACINEDNLLALYGDVGGLLMLNDLDWLHSLGEIASKLEASQIWNKNSNGYRFNARTFPYYLPFYYQEHLLSAWLILTRLLSHPHSQTGVALGKLTKELQSFAKPLSYLPRVGSSYSFSNSALHHAANFLEKQQLIKSITVKGNKQVSLRESPSLSLTTIEAYLFCSAKASGNYELIRSWMEAFNRPINKEYQVL